MSEIYLTKIERKTIFTKSLIFVLIVFIISDLTVTGPFWFNFIPWMYILGTIGSLKKIDSVLMSVISSFTVFIASIITQGGMNFACILNTLVTLSTLVLGIITGKMIYQFVLEHRLVKYIRHSKKVTYIISIIVMFFASYFMVGANSGNIFTHMKSRTNLKEYIAQTYNIQDYKIKKVNYNKKVSGKYVYTVEVDGQEVQFVPTINGKFKDGNLDTRLAKLQNELEQNIGDKAQKILEKYSYLNDTTVKFKLEYTKVAISPDTITLHLVCKTDIQSKQKLNKLYDEISNCIKELQNVKAADNITITVNDNTMQISHKDIEKLDRDYIKGGFEVEEIS